MCTWVLKVPYCRRSSHWDLNGLLSSANQPAVICDLWLTLSLRFPSSALSISASSSPLVPSSRNLSPQPLSSWLVTVMPHCVALIEPGQPCPHCEPTDSAAACKPTAGFPAGNSASTQPGSYSRLAVWSPLQAWDQACSDSLDSGGLTPSPSEGNYSDTAIWAAQHCPLEQLLSSQDCDLIWELVNYHLVILRPWPEGQY